jgi:formylglycine-generating enzyme required for sulfatase activity
VIPGGVYYRSYDKAADGLSGNMSAPATLSSFALDKYEVTVGRFRTFVNAGQGTLASPPMPGTGAHAHLAGSGWDADWNINLTADKPTLLTALKCNGMFQTWTDVPGANERRPINCVTWYEAMAFCAWDGGYLPTEAEWNYAATGGNAQRAYPWSNPPGALTPINGAYVSYSDVAGSCAGDGMMGCAVTDLVPVGSKPAGDGLWGQSDLAGNVWEWNLDWYAPAYATPCTDCADLTAATNRIIHGGSYQDNLNAIRASYRYPGYVPTGRVPNVGFRCARAP